MTENSQHSIRLLHAFNLAASKHGTQQRKVATVEEDRGLTGIPYLSHLMAVAAIVFESGGDEDAVIAALLHDVVEDQDVSVQSIRELFGDKVAAIVNSCSEHWDRVEGQGKPPWEERKQTHVERLSGADAAALLVTAADKIHNGESILNDIDTHGDVVRERFNADRQDILWYYTSVSRVVAGGLGEHTYAARRLARVVSGLSAAIAAED